MSSVSLTVSLTWSAGLSPGKLDVIGNWDTGMSSGKES